MKKHVANQAGRIIKLFTSIRFGYCPANEKSDTGHRSNN